jgi:hypothetical protein
VQTELFLIVVCDGVVLPRAVLRFPPAARENASLLLSLAGTMLVMVGPSEESLDVPVVVVVVEDMSALGQLCAFFLLCLIFLVRHTSHATCVGNNAST